MEASELGEGEVPVDANVRPVEPAEFAKWSNDPIRLYLGQMAEIPLLAREEEISLAKKIEMTRKRFRRSVLGCHLGVQNAFSILAKVHKGVLPFDRTIKVSLTERLTKEQIQARMPSNLRTLDHLLNASRQDFGLLIRRGNRHPGKSCHPQTLHSPAAQNPGAVGGIEPADQASAGHDASIGGSRQSDGGNPRATPSAD